MSLVSTIVGNNSPHDLSKGSQSAFATDHSLIEDPTGNDVVDGDGNGNIVGHDPMLGPLKNYGGVFETHVLLSGSPAIDSGLNPDSLSFDQRGTGYDRVVDGVTDMGSIEDTYSSTFSSHIVTNTNDSGAGSLRQVITDAVTGDSVTFDAGAFPDPATGTITLTSGELVIDKSLTVTGGGNVTIDAVNGSRIFNIDDGINAQAEVILSGLILQNGSSGTDGGAIYNKEHLTLSSVSISDSTAAGNGGGLYNSAYVECSLSDVQFTGNTATSGSGGGFYNGDQAICSLSNATISGNTAGTHGGGVFNTSNVQMDIETSTISSNTATSNHGGGLYNGGGCQVSVSDSAFSGNLAGQYGGAIYHNATSLVVDGVSVTDNSAATGYGGGVYSNGGTTTISGSTIARNSGGSLGGGLYVSATTATISNSTISSNSASGGSGVYTRESTTSLSNTTVASNAGGYGVDQYYRYSSLSLVSTIVGNNSPNDLQKGSESAFSADHSLIEDPTGHDVLDGDGNGNIVGHDPMLYPLGDYGGFNETHAVIDGSPVISSGANPQALTTDQRGTGFDRVVDSVDIGAVEYSANTLLTVSKSGIGLGSVSGVPGTIDCGATCSEYHDPNVSLTLTASPQTGSYFAGWTGDCSGTGTCILSMAEARAVDAEFTLIPYELTVIVEGGGDGTISSVPAGIDCGSDCTETFNYNTSVTLTANVPYGSTFVGWSEPSCAGIDPCTVVMDSHHSVTATISLNQYELSVAKTGNGTVSSDLSGIDCGTDCSELYDYNTSVVLTALADTGYTFSGWSEPSCTGISPCTVTMDQARSIMATFTLDTHELNVAKTGEGTVTSAPVGIDCGTDCNEAYDYGTAVLLTAEADTGSDFSGWTGDCSGTGECLLTMDTDRQVGALFSLENYSLTVTLDGDGVGEVTSEPAGIICGGDCEETFDYGTEVTLTATPAEGSVFVGWSGACSGLDSCVITIDQVKEVSARFDASFPWMMFLPAIMGAQK